MKDSDNDEFRILRCAAQKQEVQAGDVKEVAGNVHPTTVSRKIRALWKKKMLQSTTPNGNKYFLNFSSDFLIRGMIIALEKEGYIPLPD